MSKILSPSGSILSQEITSKMSEVLINQINTPLYTPLELSTKSQRHMSKAIRRARQMGIQRLNRLRSLYLFMHFY